jgi:hypothetical protein
MTSLAAQPVLIGASLAVIVALTALVVWVYIRRAALWPAQSDYHGITVGLAKVYDNRSLSLMLEQLREQLRTLQTLDSKKVAAGIGTQQAGEIKETSVAAGAGKAEDKSEKESPDGKSSDPASPQVSERALDLLADQVNLSYDIFNLRLMLERAISDRIMTDAQGNPASRVQAVVGFPISIDARAFAAGCAAVVEVELTAQRPLSLVAMFPQEETRNASITSGSRVNLSGSAKASGVPVSAGYQRSQSSHAIRREADTVALELPSGNKNKVIFAWEFRPTSGYPSVAPGTRQMLAVISMSEPDGEVFTSNECVDVSVSIRSYWRRFHVASQTLSNWSGWRVLLTNAPTEAKWQAQPDIHALLTEAIVRSLAPPTYNDIQWNQVGYQTAVVIVTGKNFFSGTSVVIGDKTLDRPENGLVIKSEKSLHITIPLSALTHEAVLNGRYGPSVELKMDPVGMPPCRIENLELVPLSAGQIYIDLTLVSVSGDPIAVDRVKELPAPLLDINGRFATATLEIYQGYGDQAGKVRLCASVDEEFVKIASGTTVRLTFPFLGKAWSLHFRTNDIRALLWATRCVDGATTRLRFCGGLFDWTGPWSVFLDREYKLEPNGPFQRVAADLLELEVPTEIAAKYDRAFLIGPYGSGPVTIPPYQSIEAALLPGARALVVAANSQTTVEIAGSHLSNIKQVRLAGKDLPFAVDSEGTKITVGLFGDALSAPGKYEIALVTGANDPLELPLFVTAKPAG